MPAETIPISFWLPGWATDCRVYDDLLGCLDPGLTGRAVLLDPTEDPDPAGAVLRRIECLAPRESGVALVGWSMGALAALETGLRLGPRLRSLVLFSPCARFTRAADCPEGQDERVLGRMARRIGDSSQPVLESFFREMFSPSAPERWENFRARLWKSYRVQPAARLISGLEYLRRTDLRGQVEALGVPALLVHGEDDRVIHRRLAERLAERLSRSRLVTLPGGDHVPFMGAEKELAPLVGQYLRAETL
jgi:pimeloyl-[acyl-carrier protein] methyl ester esterase